MELWEKAKEYWDDYWPYILAGGGALALLYLLNQKSSPNVTVALGNLDTSFAKRAIIQHINSSGVSDTFIFGRQYPSTWDKLAQRAGYVVTGHFPGNPDSPVTFDEWWKHAGQNVVQSAGGDSSLRNAVQQAFNSRTLAGGGWIV